MTKGVTRASERVRGAKLSQRPGEFFVYHALADNGLGTPGHRLRLGAHRPCCLTISSGAIFGTEAEIGLRLVMQTMPRCVIVDDEPAVLAFVSRFVQMTHPDFEVLGFISSVEALDFLMNEQVELIITDYKMPLLNGVQLTNIVRALNSDVPIIMISGSNMEQEALASGANAFILKPGLAAHLSPAIQQLRASART